MVPTERASSDRPAPADVLKLKRTDIRDGALWIVQNKTGARLGIEITGELAATISRINERDIIGGRLQTVYRSL